MIPTELDTRPVQIEVRYGVKWWKRPFLRLLRRPTETVMTFYDAEITSFSLGPDGAPGAQFEVRRRKEGDGL